MSKKLFLTIILGFFVSKGFGQNANLSIHIEPGSYFVLGGNVGPKINSPTTNFALGLSYTKALKENWNWESKLSYATLKLESVVEGQVNSLTDNPSLDYVNYTRTPSFMWTNSLGYRKNKWGVFIGPTIGFLFNETNYYGLHNNLVRSEYNTFADRISLGFNVKSSYKLLRQAERAVYIEPFAGSFLHIPRSNASTILCGIGLRVDLM